MVYYTSLSLNRLHRGNKGPFKYLKFTKNELSIIRKLLEPSVISTHNDTNSL